MSGAERAQLAAIIRRLSNPLDPQPTGVEPKLPKLEGIKAVVFDVYGTLLISGSGDISLTSGVSKGDAAVSALTACSLRVDMTGDELIDRLQAEIVTRHSWSEAEFPEVEIRKVWAAVFADSGVEFLWHRKATNAERFAIVRRFAIEYECRANPIWLMPNVLKTLMAIRDSKLPMGIVSNAQFFTPLSMQALFEDSLTNLGFKPEYRVWSFDHRQAKPGLFLYEESAACLYNDGITCDQVLYIGNDMRNDIWPASRVGFRTVLFAGDARSLRLRKDDPDVAGVEPDAVITDLSQILTILSLADG